MSLSYKFQAVENKIAADLHFWIASSQFTMFVFSSAAHLLLRTMAAENPMVTAYKENADLFNFYTILLPLISTLYLVKMKQKRIADINSTINIKAIGNDGWKNYEAVIQKQW
ncbi:unnamed protein product [Heligmosomoides polygyrus]|uniref:DUF4328 domain-containing protein n=1 Tax=Heligmosomoides polygyrus TaxID=6339 RepID=A0A183GK66_HELPZ|nr:unnamed protein product [Heligmosomoides polygyrus]